MNDIDNKLAQAALLRTSIVALARRMRQSARSDTETWTELMVLGAIEREKGEAMPGQISGELNMRSSNLAQVLGELERRGMIQRSPDPVDKRRVRLSLTGSGAELVRETRRKRDRWLLDAMETRLSAQERAQLIAAGELMLRLAQPSDS